MVFHDPLFLNKEIGRPGEKMARCGTPRNCKISWRVCVSGERTVVIPEPPHFCRANKASGGGKLVMATRSPEVRPVWAGRSRGGAAVTEQCPTPRSLTSQPLAEVSSAVRIICCESDDLSPI